VRNFKIHNITHSQATLPSSPDIITFSIEEENLPKRERKENKTTRG